MSGHIFTGPEGLTLLDADDQDVQAYEACVVREWATDNRTGQRMRFDWLPDGASGWVPDDDDRRYVAARKAAIVKRRRVPS